MVYISKEFNFLITSIHEKEMHDTSDCVDSEKIEIPLFAL